jgi:DNA-binding NtrC family response regulator
MARVLIAEDYDIVRTTLGEAIQLAGHTVQCVATKREAEDLLSPGSHELLICNVKLPDGSGHELAAKAASLGMKSVMMTGHPDEIEAMTTAGIIYLQKPFRLDQLSKIINDYLGA